MSLEHKMIVLGQAVKSKLQFVILLTSAAACVADQRLVLSGLWEPLFLNLQRHQRLSGKNEAEN